MTALPDRARLLEPAKAKLRSMFLADARGAGKLAARVEKKDPAWGAWARAWEKHWLAKANAVCAPLDLESTEKP